MKSRQNHSAGVYYAYLSLFVSSLLYIVACYHSWWNKDCQQITAGVERCCTCYHRQSEVWSRQYRVSGSILTAVGRSRLLWHDRREVSPVMVVKCCQDHSGFDLPSVIWSKRVKKFEAKFHTCNSLLCNVLWVCREQTLKSLNCCIYPYFV